MDEDYFPKSHNDFFMEDMSIINHLTQERVYLYECRVCASLTKNPKEHVIWHETIGN